MEIWGQSVPVESVETLSFSVEPRGAKEGDHAVGITIDGLTVTVSSPRGELEADTENVVGESFDMTVSKLGAEWTMQSHMEGGGTWYFAYKEGILVRDITEGIADGTIVVDSPNGEMTIPVTREYGMVTELTK